MFWLVWIVLVVALLFGLSLCDAAAQADFHNRTKGSVDELSDYEKEEYARQEQRRKN